ETDHDSSLQRLNEFWRDRLSTVKKLLDETQNLDRNLSYDWQNLEWSQWNPEKTQKRLIRFGKIELDFKQIAEPVRQLMEARLKELDTVTLPAILAFPNRCSLLIQTPQNARDSAINLVKAVMSRLFTSVPAGQVHFNIFDPVGLGKNFVGFMHAVDYHKALVGGRIWTDAEHIQRCLTELTTHMENVIQKYLRNEFETIEAYNQQAGELAEPYRFLVIADFPTNFTDESLRRLTSIINSGPRCGVYTLIVSDQAQKLPEGISTRELELNGVHLMHQKDHLVWQNQILRNFPLEPDSPPSEELLTDLVRKVGMASVDSSRVEVPFENITPSDDDRWSADSTFDIKIPLGRAGAKRLQHLQLGKGVNQHMLIAGKTGSGKSTLFHIIITNLALWYSPDEVELYLIDFKEGVEFKSYAVHKLPHARVVAIESDREFGLSILQRLDEEMNLRGEKFRLKRVQDIAAYRQATGEKLPRTILIIDEFHVLFTSDDKIAQESTILLEKLVRQGRAFGIHIILGSQSLAGTSGIPRSIMGQMAVRIALQCSEMDSQIILNEDNVVARLLSRPGEAIYNDAGGMVVGNNPFQVAWLPKTSQDQYLESILEFPKQLALSHEPMIIFEGNVPADITNNSLLAKAIQDPFKNNDPAKQPPAAWLGEPVTIKEPTAVLWTRQNGANLLIVGQQDFAMTGILSSTLLSLLLQLSPDAANFTILDGSPPDSSIDAKLKTIDSFFPHKCRFPKPSKIKDIILQIALEVQKRLDDSSYDSTRIQFLFISGLQRLRMLYRDEDDWSVRPDQKTLSIDRQLADIIRGGPSVGIHTIIAADTFNTVERIVDRQTLREFNNRVLLQMSASDSSNLIDSPVANQLGPQRVLFYNDELGILEKFRFYAPPDKT
ncbi:MAG: FtsK/SpoIIIE domain-containing protein, partial [Planctomycetota bacterium]